MRQQYCTKISPHLQNARPTVVDIARDRFSGVELEPMKGEGDRIDSLDSRYNVMFVSSAANEAIEEIQRIQSYRKAPAFSDEELLKEYADNFTNEDLFQPDFDPLDLNPPSVTPIVGVIWTVMTQCVYPSLPVRARIQRIYQRIGDAQNNAGTPYSREEFIERAFKRMVSTFPMSEAHDYSGHTAVNLFESALEASLRRNPERARSSNLKYVSSENAIKEINDLKTTYLKKELKGASYDHKEGLLRHSDAPEHELLVLSNILSGKGKISDDSFDALMNLVSSPEGIDYLIGEASRLKNPERHLFSVMRKKLSAEQESDILNVIASVNGFDFTDTDLLFSIKHIETVGVLADLAGLEYIAKHYTFGLPLTIDTKVRSLLMDGGFLSKSRDTLEDQDGDNLDEGYDYAEELTINQLREEQWQEDFENFFDDDS